MTRVGIIAGFFALSIVLHAQTPTPVTQATASGISTDGSPIAVPIPAPSVVCTPTGPYPVGTTMVTCTPSPSTVAVTVTYEPPPPPAASVLPLVQSTGLVYVGSFRVPSGIRSGGQANAGFEYGGTALSYNTTHNSLFLVGHDWDQFVGEIAIPTTIGTGILSTLPVAKLLQPAPSTLGLTNLLEGKINQINPTDPNAKKIGGFLPYNGNLFVSIFSYYDGGGTQTLTHFLVSPTFATTGDVQGPFQIGASPLKARMVAAYMGVVPKAWQSALGGPAFTGACCLAIVGNTSAGPAISTFDPADVGVKTPVPANALVYYPLSNPLGGGWGVTGTLYNGSTKITGAMMPEGTRSVLFFGRQGTGRFCYGPGTTNQAIDGTLVGTGPDHYCYDLEDQGKGTHAFPYIYQVWAYDANDLALARSGAVKPWEIKPYATWELKLPYKASVTYIYGATYDSQNGKIYLSQARADGTRPMIHVFTVK